MKTCRICGESKPLTAFSLHRSARDGRRGACKLCGAARERVRRVENGEAIRERQRARYAANPAQSIARVNAWVSANPERRRANALAYALRNLDKIKAWQRQNPEKLREGWRRRQAVRKARMVGNGGEITRAEWLSIVASTSGLCLYCQRPSRIVVDHVVPINRGGQTVRANLAPCCQRCNSRKGDREPFRWLAQTHGPEAVARVIAYLRSA